MREWVESCKIIHLSIFQRRQGLFSQGFLLPILSEYGWHLPTLLVKIIVSHFRIRVFLDYSYICLLVVIWHQPQAAPLGSLWRPHHTTCQCDHVINQVLGHFSGEASLNSTFWNPSAQHIASKHTCFFIENDSGKLLFNVCRKAILSCMAFCCCKFLFTAIFKTRFISSTSQQQSTRADYRHLHRTWLRLVDSIGGNNISPIFIIILNGKKQQLNPYVH